MKIEKYTAGYMFTNSYVISNDNNECIIIDPGQNYKKIYDLISSKYEIKAVLLTHGHFDHIDGIRYMSCPIYIHELDEALLYDSYLSLYEMVNLKTPFKKGDLNVIKVKDLDEINLIGLKIKVLHTKGHTLGSVCYNINEYVFSGDTLFKDSCGRTDFPTGSVRDLNESLIKIVKYYDKNYIVYPGHNDETTINDEIKHNLYIRNIGGL